MKITINRKSLVPISDISNSFSKYFRKLKDQSEPLFIMKNNSIEAVMLNVEDYEQLIEAQAMFEELELADIALRRLEKPILGKDFEDIVAERGFPFESLQD
ncbi:MAG: type II toxin-antitoxin system Phd/YefM family antitoxin [Clostridia bacterium]|jgi:PHD/YefM family antitoxin component YafN of YafNO toxin-antitoxin module|nr:type II toxin-antitoxin system Phd/YefM family antitoxin [Clostridia bacterium]